VRIDSHFNLEKFSIEQDNGKKRKKYLKDRKEEKRLNRYIM
jgi:hypothetical protein